jgi:hypothetical protein
MYARAGARDMRKEKVAGRKISSAAHPFDQFSPHQAGHAVDWCGRRRRWGSATQVRALRAQGLADRADWAVSCSNLPPCVRSCARRRKRDSEGHERLDGVVSQAAAKRAAAHEGMNTSAHSFSAVSACRLARGWPVVVQRRCNPHAPRAGGRGRRGSAGHRGGRARERRGVTRRRQAQRGCRTGTCAHAHPLRHVSWRAPSRRFRARRGRQACQSGRRRQRGGGCTTRGGILGRQRGRRRRIGGS